MLKVRIRPKRIMEVLMIIALLLPFFQPGCTLYITIGKFSGLDLLFQLLKPISIIFFFIYIRKIVIYTPQERNLILLFAIFGLIQSISEYHHTGSVLYFNYVVNYFSFAYICTYFMTKRQDDFLNALTFLFGIYNLIEFITIVLYYPYGMTNYHGLFWDDTIAGAKYFFGSKNQAIFYILAFLLCVIIKDLKKYGYIKCKIYMYIIFFLIEIKILDSSNSLACLLLFTIFLIIIQMKIKHLNWLFNSYFYFGTTIVIFFIVCIFTKASEIPILGEILKAFGRNATFTNRIYIWEIALKGIAQKPILGVGKEGISVMNSVQMQMHNVYLDIMYKYGLISFLLYFIILAYVASMLRKSKSTAIGKICIVMYFIMLLHNCFDTMDNFMFILLITIYSLSNKIRNKKFIGRNNE